MIKPDYQIDRIPMILIGLLFIPGSLFLMIIDKLASLAKGE